MNQNYKIFINEKVLFLGVQNPLRSAGLEQIEPPVLWTHYDFTLDLKKIVNEMKLQGTYPKEVYIQVQDEVELQLIMDNTFHKIVAAGGIVYREDGEILFIFRNGRWDLPKGKLETNESPEIAAVREVEEETGVQGVVNNDFIALTHHVYFEGDNIILKETHWFSMKAEGHSPLIPQQEEGIEEVRWIPKHEIAPILESSFPSIKELWNKLQGHSGR